MTFVGVFEHGLTDSDGDSQMTDANQQQDFMEGPPRGLPTLHVLCSQKDYIMSRTVKNVSLTQENKQMLSEAAQKIAAVLTLILGGDKVAAEYCLVSLVSRVYKNEAAFLIGNLPLNVTGVTKA